MIYGDPWLHDADVEEIVMVGAYDSYKVIYFSPFLKNNGNIPLPLFGGNYPIVILDNI